MNIANMVLRMVMRRLLSHGINAGVDKAFGAKKRRGMMNGAEQGQDRAVRQNTRRAKQGLKAARRLGRF